MKDNFTKIYCFFALFVYVIGAIGGIGTCLYHHEYVYAFTTLALAAMAFPVAKGYLEKLKS